MPVLAGVGIGLAAVGALGSLFGGIFGGGAKEEAALAGADLTQRQSEFTKLQVDEQVRRFELESSQKVGMARAAVGASGFAAGGSLTKYADAIAKELGLESAWMKRAGYQTAEFQRQAARVQRQAAHARHADVRLGQRRPPPARAGLAAARLPVREEQPALQTVYQNLFQPAGESMLP